MKKDMIAKLWQERGLKYGDTLQSVCFANLPGQINSLIHDWQINQVYNFLSDFTQDAAVRVLDIGCGWGRIAKPLSEKFPRWQITGVDPAPSMVELFNKNLTGYGQAQIGSLPKLKFPDQSFDVIVIVTTLMYLDSDAKRQQAASEIDRLLKVGGRCIVIENNQLGHQILTGFGIAHLWTRKTPSTGGYIFSSSEILNLFSLTRLTIKKITGMPIITIFIPVMLLASRITPSFVSRVSKLILLADKMLAALAGTSLYRAYNFVKGY